MDSKVNGGTEDKRFLFRDGAMRDVEAFTVADGKTTIQDTSTVAIVGSVVRFENGAYQYLEATVVEVPNANSFIVGAKLSALVVGDDFYILKRATQRVDDTGAQLVVSSNGPVQYVLDGVDTEVQEDTAVPANSRPLPTKIMANGDDIDFGAGAQSAQTLRAVLVDEQVAQIGSLTEVAPATDTASSGLNGRLQRIAQRITSFIALLPASLGQKASAASLAVVLSTEQEAEIGALTETAPATDTASSGLNGRLQRIAQRLTSLIALLPASLGQKADAASFAVTISTEGTAQLGSLTETAPATDTASSGLNGRLQRIAQRITSMIALLPASLGQKASAASFAVTLSTEQEAELGIVTETAPATDTASSGLNGRLQRIAQRITSLIALVPASLGQKASAASFAVTLSTEQEAELGIVTETAPATDTASSGLNGRLQRIAQRITSLIALVPASLGQKTMANSFAVTLASDQTSIPTTPAVKAAVTVKQAKITVGTSAVRLTTDAAAPSATRQNLVFMADPGSSANFYLGSSGVTTANGLPIFVGQNIQYKDDCNDYYIISDAAAQSVYVVEAE